MAEKSHYSTLSSAEIYRIAAEACCDPRTVILVFKGKGHEMSRAKIMAALKRLKLDLELDPIVNIRGT